MVDKTEQITASKKHAIRKIGTFHTGMRNGGTEKVLSLLIPLWIKMRYEVVLFTDEEGTEKDYFWNYDGVQRVVFRHKSEVDEQNIFDREAEWKKYIGEFGVDVVVYHAWMSPMLPYDMRAVQSAEIPFLIYTHGVFSTIYHGRMPETNIWPKIFKESDGVVSLTEVSARFYECMGCNAYYTHNPVSEELNCVQTAKADNHTVLWIGRISEEKKPLDGIEIFERVHREIPDAKLLVVGDGQPRLLQQMREKCRQYNLEDAVTFCGYQLETDRYYRDSSVMIMTSVFEGYSMTLLESKAYGVPCVMYELPYLYLAQNSGGLCAVKQGDTESAAAEVIRLLSDKALCAERGKAARASFDDIYRYDLAGCWKSIFEDMETGKGCMQKHFSEEVDRQMLQLLVEHGNIGADKSVEDIKRSREYVFGTKVYTVLRKIKRALLRFRK